MPVFFVCAGLIGLLVVALTMHVGRLRGRKKIFLGDGGDPEMLAAIRAHANLVEFAPICLDAAPGLARHFAIVHRGAGTPLQSKRQQRHGSQFCDCTHDPLVPHARSQR